MDFCNDIELLANNIALSGAELKKDFGTKSFFVPFFNTTSKEQFKKSAILSSAYFNATNISKTYPFCNIQTNSTISQILEHNIGISGSEYMYKFHDISKDIGNNNLKKIDYSYLSENFKDFLQ